jgi:hypothetical protein
LKKVVPLIGNRSDGSIDAEALAGRSPDNKIQVVDIHLFGDIGNGQVFDGTNKADCRRVVKCVGSRSLLIDLVKEGTAKSCRVQTRGQTACASKQVGASKLTKRVAWLEVKAACRGTADQP